MPIRPIAVVVILLFTARAHAQGAAAVALDVVAGGDTNDVQVSYAAALEAFRTNRVSGVGELRYVRDFFEFEPDDPISDALTFSGVTALGFTARILVVARVPEHTEFIPYAIAGASWLRASTADATANHPGYVAGVGMDVLAHRGTTVSIEAKRFATIGGAGPVPHGAFSFWTVGIGIGFRWRQ